MVTRQITQLGLVFCAVIVVACSSNTNSTGPMPATAIDKLRNLSRLYETPPPAGWQFYTPNPFTSPICSSDPCTPKLDSGSTSMVKQMMNGKFSMGEIQVAEPGTSGGYGESDEFATYYTNGSDPAYSITCTEDYSPLCSQAFTAVSIPNGAYASSDDDHHTSVILQSSGQTSEYDLWEFNCFAKSLSKGKAKGKCMGTTDPVTGGGTLYVSYGSLCNANSFANKGTCLGSAVAAGVPTQPGLLDPRELSAAQIKHVLFVAVGCPNGEYVWPADNSDGYGMTCTIKGGPAEGERVWLDLSNSQIDQLNDPKWARAILHAMHNYGLFVVGTAGDFKQPWGFHSLDSAGFNYIGETDPWATFFDSIGCQGPSNPCGYSKNASHLLLPQTGIKQSDIHIVP